MNIDSVHQLDKDKSPGFFSVIQYVPTHVAIFSQDLPVYHSTQTYTVLFRTLRNVHSGKYLNLTLKKQLSIHFYLTLCVPCIIFQCVNDQQDAQFL